MPNYVKTKISTITSHLTKLSELEILLEVIPPLSENGPWVAGGSLLRTHLGISINTDVDFFFKDKQQYEKYITDVTTSPNFIVLNSQETKWHTTLTIDYKGSRYLLQLIHKKFFTSACNLLDSFDMNICQIAFDGKHLYHAEKCLEQIKDRQIIVENLKFPNIFMERALKYSKLGFNMSREEIAKFFNLCSRIKNDPSQTQTNHVISIKEESYDAIE
jgi:hypothetical protein